MRGRDQESVYGCIQGIIQKFKAGRIYKGGKDNGSEVATKRKVDMHITARWVL